MTHRTLLLGFVFVAVFSAPAVAVVMFSVNAPHDLGNARYDARGLIQNFEETAELLHKMEACAVINFRKPPIRFLEDSFRFESQTRADIERSWGAPVKFVESEYARPISANDFDQQIDGLREDDLKPENDRVKFYAIKNLGCMQVIYNKDNVPLRPVFIYLKVDKGFVPLKSDADLRTRIRWELAKLRKLNDAIGVPDKETLKGYIERAKKSVEER